MTTPLLPAELVPSARDVRYYGWKPDLPDPRDRKLAAPATTAALPSLTMNWQGHTAIPIYDQGPLGSCTANATLRAYRIAIRRTVGGLHDFDGSRLAHYYWTRAIDGSEGYDAGAYIRDAFKVLGKVGVAPERAWPYQIGRFRDAPPLDVVQLAAKRLRLEYLSVPQTEAGIKSCLVARRPVVFGMAVFPSTEQALDSDGLIPRPSAGEPVLGGHAMAIEDFDDINWDVPVYLTANSWGLDVGLGAGFSRWPESARKVYAGSVAALRGYVAIPQAMLHDPEIADDFWTVRLAA